MKKITFLFLLLTVSFGYSQVVLEDFESLDAAAFSGFEGLGGSNIVANPSVDVDNMSATTGELIVVTAGQPWQGANLVMQDNYIDASTPASQPVQILAYSLTPFNILARLADAQGGAAESATDAAHTGSGWETLTFTFTDGLDSTAPANGEYGIIAFFPNWNGAGWHDPEIERTVYIDRVFGFAGAAVPVPVPDPAAAPIPTVADGEVYSIYNDTNAFTTTFPFAYNFGSISGEPDLDPGAGVNQAFKFDFTVAGYGAGEGGPDDVSSYNFVTFDYYAVSDGTLAGFRFVMISNNGGVTEHNYEIGTDEALVTDAWTKVSIPMSHFTGLGFSETNFFQWKFDPFMQSVVQGGIVYVDNILLTQNVLSTDSFETSEFQVFPNPATNNWTIKSNQVISEIQVFNILGKQVKAINSNLNEVNIDATDLSSGIYLARINGENSQTTIKLIKE